MAGLVKAKSLAQPKPVPPITVNFCVQDHIKLILIAELTTSDNQRPYIRDRSIRHWQWMIPDGPRRSSKETIKITLEKA
jgi:hypothetical protein